MPLGRPKIKITFDVDGHLMPNAADQVADRLGSFVFSEEAVASASSCCGEKFKNDSSG